MKAPNKNPKRRGIHTNRRSQPSMLNLGAMIFAPEVEAVLQHNEDHRAKLAEAKAQKARLLRLPTADEILAGIHRKVNLDD